MVVSQCDRLSCDLESMNGLRVDASFLLVVKGRKGCVGAKKWFEWLAGLAPRASFESGLQRNPGRFSWTHTPHSSTCT